MSDSPELNRLTSTALARGLHNATPQPHALPPRSGESKKAMCMRMTLPKAIFRS